MRVTVNGVPRVVEPATTLEALLPTLGVDLQRVAVALNGSVVPRGERPSRVLAEGDAVEVIEPVGGG